MSNKRYQGSLPSLLSINKKLSKSSSVHSDNGSLNKSRKLLAKSLLNPESLPRIVDKRSKKRY